MPNALTGQPDPPPLEVTREELAAIFEEKKALGRPFKVVLIGDVDTYHCHAGIMYGNGTTQYYALYNESTQEFDPTTALDVFANAFDISGNQDLIALLNAVVAHGGGPAIEVTFGAGGVLDTEPDSYRVANWG